MGHSYRIHWEQYGDPARTPVLFLHGFMGSCADVDDLLPLTDNFRLIAVDLPGHGRTAAGPDPDNYTMESCAAELAGFLTDQGLDRFFVVGYSMGGRLGLYLAMRYPSMVDKAVIESGSPGLRSEQERRARIGRDEAVVRLLGATTMRQFVEKWYGQSLFDSLRNNGERFREIVERRLTNDPQGLILSLRMMGTGVQPSLWEELDRIRAPLLLIAGEKDRKFVDIAQSMASACRRAEVAIVEGAGHNVQVENPQGFVMRVRRFFED